jgi:hypothetical protein
MVDGGVGHHGIQAVAPLAGCLDGRVEIRLDGHVRRRMPDGSAKSSRDRCKGVSVGIDHGHPGTAVHEFLSSRSADAAGGSRDEDGLADKAGHGLAFRSGSN